MKKDLQKSHLEKIDRLENIVNEMVHVSRGIHTDHIFNRRDVYHHGSQEVRVFEYSPKHHAYSFSKRIMARAELFYLGFKDLMKR